MSTAEQGFLVARPVQDVKLAACLIAMQMPLAERGIYIRYDAEHPKQSTGGLANFHFRPELAMHVARLTKAFSSETAQDDLEKLFTAYKRSENPEVAQAATEMFEAWQDALMRSGRDFIDQYVALIRYLKTEAQEVVVTAGEEAKDENGLPIGRQGFEAKFIRRT